MLRPERPAASLAVAVAVAAAGAAALALGGCAATSDDPAGVTGAAPATPVSAPALGAIQPGQAAAFGVLRRSRRASDAMPAAVASSMAGPGRFGRNAALARAIRTTLGTGWVVPGRDTVCLIVPDVEDGYATTCRPTATAATDGVTLQRVARRSSSSLTLVPDGGRVTVTRRDGTTAVARPDASGVVDVGTTGARRITVRVGGRRAATAVPRFDGTAGPAS